MRKSFLMVQAVVLVAAMAAPAMADFSSYGWMKIKAHTEQNMTGGLSGGGFITPGKDGVVANYVEQRSRFTLNWKSEHVGAVAQFEIDFGAYGDSAYTVGRNQGAGLESDSVNLETKNFYMWFDVPNTNVKVTAGLLNQTDSFGGMIYGFADMGGLFVTGKVDPLSYKVGAARFQSNDKTLDDAVDLLVAEAKFAPMKDAKFGVDLYVIRDASGNKTTFAGGQTNLSNTLGRITTDYGLGTTAFTYDPSTFFFLGADGGFKAGPVDLSGFGFYNFGKIKKPVGASAVLAIDNNSDIDVKAFAFDLRADANLGPTKTFIEGAYVSGTGSGDKDFKSPITASNYAFASSYPLTSMNLQILTPSWDDINAGTSVAYDVQNKGRGIMIVAAGSQMNFTDMLSGKVGIGYLTDAKNTVGGLVKKHKATEVNANVNYAIVKGMDLGLYGAYVFLSDWEDYGRLGNGVANFNQKPDNIYKAYARINYAF